MVKREDVQGSIVNKINKQLASLGFFFFKDTDLWKSDVKTISLSYVYLNQNNPCIKETCYCISDIK